MADDGRYYLADLRMAIDQSTYCLCSSSGCSDVFSKNDCAPIGGEDGWVVSTTT